MWTFDYGPTQLGAFFSSQSTPAIITSGKNKAHDIRARRNNIAWTVVHKRGQRVKLQIIQLVKLQTYITFIRPLGQSRST